ncbi:MAG: HD domain-containing protein [Thermodesulfobacteriota bacterium]
MPALLDNMREVLNRREGRILSPAAARSADGVRRREDRLLENDYRQPFAVDVDRILHSLAYTRYIDKTQVFYLVENDHITHRVLHVQLVSRVARTIGRLLELNEDLIEAIALGHDIGHAPFGHEGEMYLSRLCREAGIDCFLHNVQSVQFLDRVERKGKGCNLCLQTLDGILCHDGEVHNRTLKPVRVKTFEVFEDEILRKKKEPDLPLVPMTMEGCVVRFADTISYIGRDIEDAIRLKLISREDLPRPCTRLLGDTNGKIVFALVTDIIRTSMNRDSIAFSEEISQTLQTLKAFNYERIYRNPKIKAASDTIRRLFEMLFERYCRDIETGNSASVIFTSFLHDMSEAYVASHRTAEIVRDFLAGMTDQYFIRQCPPDIRPALVWQEQP